MVQFVKRSVHLQNSPDSNGINAMRWLRKTLAAFIRVDSGTFQYDEVSNPSLLAKNKNRIFKIFRD